MVKYIPSRGDVVWISFDPQKGKEIKKTRPAFVVSPKKYNEKVGMALFMPITSQIKGYPFEVVVEEKVIKGAVLCDQIRSFDWQARKAKFILTLSPEKVEIILNRLAVLIN